MKKIFFACAMAMLCCVASAQNAIKGRVVDGNGMPLAGATVFVHDLNKGTVADAAGNYELLNLPAGRMVVQFSFVGMSNVIKTVQFDNADAQVDVVLKPTALEAEEVVVSGIHNATQHDNAVKIDVLKITPLGLAGTPNFMESIAKVPGVDMISKGSGVSKPVIRGLSMNDVLVLNNGVRFENYQYSSHHPLGIDEFGIADVEVIKGPASLLYGSDAIGGVVNFIKEKPAPVGSIMGDYSAQAFSNSRGLSNSVGVRGSSDRFFGSVRAGFKTHEDYLQGGGDFVPNSRFNENSLKANVGTTGRRGTLKLFYDYSTQELGLVEDEAVEQIGQRGRKNGIYYQQLNTHLVSTQNRLFLGQYSLDLNAAYQNTELAHWGEVNECEIQMRLATLTYEARLHLPSTGSSDYIVGFQGMRQENSNVNNRDTKLLPDAVTNNYSGFALVQRSLQESLKLQAGIRFDRRSISTEPVGSADIPDFYREPINRDYSSFSGSAGATYNFSDKFLVRANVAAAYRTPNLAELTSKGQHELRFEVGDSSLDPEKSYEGDLSFHWHTDSFMFDAAGFYNRINDYIFIAPTGAATADGIGVYQYRQANSSLIGGEVGFHLHPNAMRWMHFETTFSSVVGKQSNGEYLPFIPAHKLRFDLRVEKEQLWLFKDAFLSANSCSAFAQRKVAVDETPTDAYSLIGIGIGGNLMWNTQPIFVGFNISNLFDEKYIDHLSTLKEVNLYNPGRNISFTLKIPFEFIVR